MIKKERAIVVKYAKEFVPKF